MTMRPVYRIMFWFSVILTGAALAAVLAWGIGFGVDFLGGSLLEVTFDYGRPPLDEVAARFNESTNDFLHGLTLTPVGDNGLIILSPDRTHMMHSGVWIAVERNWPDAGVRQLRFDFVGPLIGSELKSKSVTAIVLVLVLICGYIAIVFRGMRRVLSPWKLSVATMAALAHDVLIPLGVFAALTRFSGVEVGAAFVAALLTVMGYSISDTVVVFDRVRENTVKGRLAADTPFGELVHRSIMETLWRSISTSLTTLLPIVAIYFFGGPTLKYFALALAVGIFAGAYSSIFVASPILVWLSRKGGRS